MIRHARLELLQFTGFSSLRTPLDEAKPVAGKEPGASQRCPAHPWKAARTDQAASVSHALQISSLPRDVSLLAFERNESHVAVAAASAG